MLKQLFLPFLLLLLLGCSAKKPSYIVGIDPTFSPAPLASRQVHVYAFSKELLQAIAKREKISFKLTPLSWDTTASELREKKCAAIFSSISPRVSLESIYTFSLPILSTGPVLVTKRGGSGEEALLSSRGSIGVETPTQEVVAVEKYPDAEVYYYSSLPKGLDEVVGGQADGILLNYFQAISYVHNLYAQQLEIATLPLTSEGIRLLILKGGEENLIKIFDRGLKRLKEEGEYEKLLKKWQLG